MSYADILKKHGINKTSDEEDKSKSKTTTGSGIDAINKKHGLDVTIDENFINTFIQDSSAFFTQSQADWENLSWESATNQENHKKRQTTADDLTFRRYAIRDYLRANKDRLNEDAYNELTSYIDAADYSGIANQFARKSKEYSQYKSEDEYQQAVKANKDRDYLLHLDLDLYQQQIDALKAEKEDFVKRTTANGRGMEDFERKTKIATTYDNSIAAMTERYQTAKRLQEAEKLAGVADINSKYYDPEFKSYTGYASTKKEGLIDSYGDIAYEIINGNSDAWSKVATKQAWGLISDDEVSALNSYEQMESNEVAIYNYYYATSGKEAAEAYLHSIQETLNARVAGKEFAAIDDKPLLELLFGVSAGLDQFESGMKSLFNTEDDYIPASSVQIMSGMVREDLKDTDLKWYNFKEGQWEDQKILGNSLGQSLYDFTTTSANMAPSILVSTTIGMLDPTLGAIAGNTLLGASAAGNAYQEKLNLGYSKEEARAYGTMVGISEATLQYLLGGVGKLGKNTLTNTALKSLDAVDNVFARFARSSGGKILLNGVSEAVEEGLQAVIEPYLWKAVSGEDMGVDWQEVLYSSLLGFATGGLFEAGETAIGNAAQSKQYIKYGKDIMAASGGIDAALELAQKMNSVTDPQLKRDLAKQIEKVSAVKESGKTGKAAEKKVGKLYNTAMAAANAQNKADIVKSLERSGVSPKEASAIADALVAAANRQSLTWDQNKVLKSVQDDNAVEYAIKHIVNNNKSTMGQRVQQVAGFDTNIKVDKFVREAFTPKGKYAVSTKGEATKLEIEEDANGKTITKDTGETIEIKGVHEIRRVEVDGKTKFELILKLSDGTTINAENVAFANKNDALIYEAIANLGDNIDPKSADKLIAKYDGSDAMVFARAMAQAYTYGFYGMDRSEMVGKHSLATELTEDQRNYAYGLGEQYRPIKDQNDKADAQKKIAESGKKPSEKGVYYRDKDGKATDISTYLKESGIKLNDAQKTGIEAMRKLSEMLGVRFNVFESWVENGTSYYLDENGVKTEGNPNGFYDTTTGEIYIDLHAGNNYEGTILFTVAHELTHFMRQWSPEHFTKIASIVFKHGGMKGNVSELIALKQKKAKDKGKPISYDTAMEEVVADGMETILKDGKVVEFMAEVKQKDRVAWEKIKGWFKKLSEFLRKMVWAYRSHSAQTTEGSKVADFAENLLNQIEQIFAEGAVASGENYKAAMENVVEAKAEAVSSDEIITDGAVVTDGEGTKFSIKSMKHDIAEGQMFEDLKNYCGWTQSQVNELRNNLNDLVEYMAPHRNILDMNETYGREGRRFSPYKPNSDPLYKISMDFSTLCSKRLLTQYVIENLQLRENRPMSAEEQMAIRDMLNEYRKVEKGLQVACAMCYVEAARLKSPKQIQRWLADPEPHLRNYFALKNSEFNAKVKEAQANFKESRGYARNAPKKDMKQADVKELNKIGPKMRSQYQLSAEEQAIVEKAKTLPNSTYLTAGNLADLSETDPAIYSAYTSFVRTATRSKSLETDEPYYYGDSNRDNGNGIIVSDSFIESVNRENGMRFSSWSDWRIQHLLDYITAVIDNSVRGAAMHGYTKFGEEVRVLGKTGMMFNMSGVAGTQTGLNPDGSLNFSETESIDVNEAIQLREEFPEHAGLQCIGVSNEHIIALLESDIIDYVIPYHVSGLNKALRTMAKIQGWADYTGTQNASIDKSIKKEDAVDPEHWHEEPVFSEFFVGYETGMSGIEAMRESAERYKQMCKDRGLTPKFNQFANEANYWKLLIDRKMINQQTGELIRQKAVTPTFDFDTIKSVVDRYVDNYDSGLEARALNHIVENWDSVPNRIKDLKKQGGTKAKKTKKAVGTLANQTLAAQPVDKTKLSMRETVEETKDLLAYHNITTQLLLDALNRKGLLMPSLAVTNKGMTDFGEISLLFDKSTIDPNANSENKLFGADAWTPTQTKLKKNAKFDTNKTVRTVNSLKNRIGSKFVSELFNVSPKQFKDTIIKADGSIYDAYAHHIGMQTAYAMEAGIISKIPTKNGKVDQAALQAQLNSEMDTDNGWRQYKKWLNNISDTVITSYDTATNEDILNNMKAQPSTAKAFKLSENGELVVPAVEYSSIDEARKNKNRLSENAEEATKAVADEFLAFAKKFGGDVKSVVGAINAAFASRYSTADIVKSFKANGIEISSEAAGELQSLYKKAVELPTQYFEAKPGREVGLDEIKAVVMPADADHAEVKGKLEELGIQVVEYDGSKESRVEALNSMDSLKFSDRILMGSLFSGGGTLEAGLVYQMLDNEFAVEYNKKIAATYTDNHGKEHMFVGDVQDFDSKGKKNVFYLHASPVCKNFSPASHSGGETTLDITTAQATARVLEEQMPQVFTVENVKRYIGSEAYNIIINKLNELGYTWDVDVYKASDYGNATKRERMVIRAVKDGDLPAKPEKASSITSWGEATRDLWETDLIPSTLVRSKIEAIRNTPQLKNLRLTKLDKPLMIYDTTKSKQVTYAWADELAPTLTTKCGDARIIMPDGRVYEPTPKFMGRIQGLPDDYKYPKAKTNAFKIIGNGIPTQLTKAVMGGVLDSAYEQTHEGKVLYQDRDTDSVSNRSLLANAFEGMAQNDIERNKIQEYKSKISLIDAEEKKLRELNEQIKELSFSKGPRDTKKIKSLQFDANQAANRINTYDKQLLRLEASKPLQDILAREKKRAYKKAEQEGKKALAKQREKAAETQRALLEKWQDSRKKAVENREKTAMRHKIQRVVGELNDLLLSNDKKRHVPENLKKAVADALSLVNMDTVGAEERAAKYAALIAKETDPDKIAAYTVTMENILRQGEKMGQRLKELRDAYEEFSESDDPDIANAYDPVIAGSLKELASSIGNTSLRNMTIDQLQDVYDMYKMVLTRVRDANKSFTNARNEAIGSLASRVVGEVRRIRGERKYRLAILDAVRSFSWNNLKPVYAMERIGSNTLVEAFNSVRAGEDTWAKDVGEARAYYLDKSKKYGYDSWDFDKKYTFKSTSGLEFELTLEQIMSLYAYSKREQALDHLRLGGFVFDSNIETYKEKDGKTGKSILKYKVNTAEAHQISVDILAEITGKLSTEQKSFVDDMQEYLSTVMGAKGNEVTMKMYGVKLFKEKFYFPLKSAKQFLFEQNEVAGEVRIKNSGFTNKVVARANNPVILNGFMDVWSDHVNDMSMYHSFVLPLEDFNRIFNYKSPKKEGQPPVSVKGTIQGAYSPAAVDYVKQLITDLNGGAMSDPRETLGKRLAAKFKKAKVFAFLSVVIQQPSAIGRAFALVDLKYFRPTKDGMNHDQLWDELKQYAPVAVIKEMGYFDTNMGRSTRDFIKAKEYSSFKDKVKGFFTDAEYRDEKLSRLPALADEVTWCAIWNAVKRETVSTHKDLRPGSEEFLKAAGERFTEVVTKTQVYDSVLARSANMRSKSGLMSMITSFMAEPTTSINMLEDAILKGKRGNKGYAARAFASVAVSIILNNALVAIVYAMRDDDEDETFVEKYMQALVSGMLDDINPLTYYPYLKDIWSLFQGYDVERADMSLISDLADATKGLIKAYTTDDGDVVGAWHNLAGTFANLGGIPMDNIRRDITGGINFVNTIIEDVNGRATTWGSMGDTLLATVKDSIPVWGWFPDEKKSDNLYDAIINGDTAYVNRMKGSYKTENAYHSAVRTALRENDPRIKEAAIAGYNGDPSERVRIAKLIIADGFDQDDVVVAINAEINKMEPNEASDPKKKGFYTAEDFAREIANGDQATANAAKTDIIRTAEKNGKTEDEAEDSFKSSAKSEMKKLYLSGDLSESKTVNALVSYCGMDETEAELLVESYGWEKQGYESATSAAVRDYNTYCATLAVPKDVYLHIRSFSNNTENDKDANGKSINYSAMKKVIAEIDAQRGLSSAQKTAIARSLGWSDKNINKYKTW